MIAQSKRQRITKVFRIHPKWVLNVLQYISQQSIQRLLSYFSLDQFGDNGSILSQSHATRMAENKLNRLNAWYFYTAKVLVFIMWLFHEPCFCFYQVVDSRVMTGNEGRERLDVNQGGFSSWLAPKLFWHQGSPQNLVKSIASALTLIRKKKHYAYY